MKQKSDSTEEIHQELPERRPTHSHPSAYPGPVHRHLPIEVNPSTGPLSEAQESVWFLEKLAPGMGVYNNPYAYDLRGSVNIGALRASVNEIIKRHASLRTNFKVLHDEPIQVVKPNLKLRIPLIDLTSFNKTQQNQKIEKLLDEDPRTPFTLEKDPLIRIKIIRLSENHHILYMVIHHIVTDDWSMGVFEHELSIFYNAFLQGKVPKLNGLEIQYLDYARRERANFQNERLERQIAYWRDQLKDTSPLDLPTDHPRPLKQSFRSGSQSFEISRDLVNQLKNIGHHENATLFMVTLAAFNILLSRYTGQDDILIGTPVANRNRRELEDLIGYLVNNVILRTNLSSHPSFNELLKRVRRITLEALMNQELSLERLMKEIRVERDLSRNPLFQVLFVYHNAPFDALHFSGLELTRRIVQSESAKVDLALVLEEEPAGLQGRIIYNADLFNPASIVRMIKHFTTLLEGISSNPDQKISSFEILTDEECYQLTSGWNNTFVAYPTDRCLHELVEEQAQKHPDRIAVVDQNRQITYRDLNSSANQLAEALRKLGVGPDILVGLYLERSIELAIGSLAVLKAGGAFVPYDPSHPMDRVSFMIKDSKPRAILTLKKHEGNISKQGIKVICVDDPDHFESETTTNPPRLTTPGNLCYVIYTSGSSGKPKGVMIEHASIVNFVHWWQRAFSLNSKDRIGSSASSAFDASVWETFGALTMGATLDILPESIKRSTTQLWHWLAGHNITAIWIVTSLAMLALEEDIPSNIRLRFLAVGGEILPSSPRKNIPFPIYNFYGPTEATIVTTMSRVDPKSDNQPPIGRPIDNVKVYILDNELNLVPVGIPGELHISGMGLARGYLNDADLTDRKFIANPFSRIPGERLYKTGDLVRRLPDGQIEFLGRMDHQVKVRGYRIDLGEIETHLKNHPSIKDAVTIATKDSTGNTRLIAFIIPRFKEDVAATELRNFLGQKIPDYMLPTHFLFVESFPMTPSGKVDRGALIIPDADAGIIQTVYRAPGNELEKKLVDIWKNILGVKRVGVNDDFFNLGGHSLAALRLVNQIRDKLHYELPLEIIFQAPSVAQQARIIQTGIKEKNWSSLVAVQPNGFKLPFFCISPTVIDVVTYSNLSQYLDPSQPFYALYVRKSKQFQDAVRKNGDVIDQFIRDVQKIQPKGPYLLGGYSAGGKLAIEMALRLQDRGEVVNRVVLFDSFAPGYPRLYPFITPRIFRMLRILRRIESYLWKFWVLDWRGKLDLAGSKQQPFSRRVKAWFNNRYRELKQPLLADPFDRVKIIGSGEKTNPTSVRRQYHPDPGKSGTVGGLPGPQPGLG